MFFEKHLNDHSPQLEELRVEVDQRVEEHLKTIQLLEYQMVWWVRQI